MRPHLDCIIRYEGIFNIKNIKNSARYSNNVCPLIILLQAEISRPTPSPPQTPFYKISFQRSSLIHPSTFHTTIFLHREQQEAASFKLHRTISSATFRITLPFETIYAEFQMDNGNIIW